MKSRRGKTIAALLTSSTAVLAGLVWLAPAANAATVSVTLECDRDVAILADPGDAIDFRLGTGCGGWFLSNYNGRYGVDVTQSGYVEYVSSSAPERFHANYIYANDWYIKQTDALDLVVTAKLLTLDGASTPLAPGATIADVDDDLLGHSFGIVWAGPRPKENPPPPWFQSYARPTAETACETGWSPSWAQWPHDGNGGYVCDREQYYDVNSGEWLYR